MYDIYDAVYQYCTPGFSTSHGALRAAWELSSQQCQLKVLRQDDYDAFVVHQQGLCSHSVDHIALHFPKKSEKIQWAQQRHEQHVTENSELTITRIQGRQASINPLNLYLQTMTERHLLSFAHEKSVAYCLSSRTLGSMQSHIGHTQFKLTGKWRYNVEERRNVTTDQGIGKSFQ